MSVVKIHARSKPRQDEDLGLVYTRGCSYELQRSEEQVQRLYDYLCTHGVRLIDVMFMTKPDGDADLFEIDISLKVMWGRPIEDLLWEAIRATAPQAQPA